jgi:hypothetical protein
MFISNEGDEDVSKISLFAVVINISVKTRTPKQEELDSWQHVILTSDTGWEPNDIKFPQIGAHHREASTDLESAPGDIYNILGFSQRLVASCRIKSSNASAVVRAILITPTFQTEERSSDISPEQLADRWMIGLETARQT